MAMTIEQQPAYKLQPAGSDWIFTISSTNVSGNYKYKFIIDLQIEQSLPSANTIRLKVSPNDAGVGIINISSILQDYVSFDLLGMEGTSIKAEFKGTDASATNRFALPLIDKLSMSESSVFRLNVKIGEEFSTTANGAPTLTAAVTALDDLVFYNGVSYNNEQTFTGGNYGLNPADWNSKNYVLDGTTGTALTNAPTESQYIGDNEYATLAHLNGWTGAAVCQASKVEIKLYDSSDVLLNTRSFTYSSSAGGYNGTGDSAFVFGPRHVQHVGVGPANVKGWNTVPATWSYYTVIFQDSGSVSKSKTYKYIRRDADCKGFEKIRLCWINKFGVWDYYTFTKKSTKETKINRNYYSSVKGNWNNSTFTKDGVDRGRGVVTTKATESININSDWISTDEEAAWLEELFISPSVYMLGDYDASDTGDADYGNYMTPVVITNSDYQRYTRVNDKVSLYNIDLEYSIDKKVQKA